MEFTRTIWIAIICGVPIFVGGGLVYALFGFDITALVIFEMVMLFVFGGFIKPGL